MQRVLTVRCLAAVAAFSLILSLAACGGSNKANTKIAKILVSPTTISLKEGDVATLSAIAQNSDGAVIPADITFSSSNTAIATVSSGGLVCGGVWDSSIINCQFTVGQGGVGQAQITATSGDVNASATVYVHLQVDQVQAVLSGGNCTTFGQTIPVSGKAFNTTAPGCSVQSPCDITSTVGPFTFGANDPLVAATSAGINPTYNPDNHTPTYLSGGTITGSKGQTCNLTNFNNVLDATGTVMLTDTNKIAAGTQLTITASGFGATVPPTTATLGNGTATCSGTANVQTSLTSGLLSAQEPGATTIFASVSGVNSVGVNYMTCPVVGIKIHDVNSDSTSFSIAPQGTQELTADVVDSAGQTIKPALTWGSSNSAAATISFSSNRATVTGKAGGTAYVAATCIFPTCNRHLPAQYTQNLATFAVSQPAATKVYAANNNSGQLVPIDTATNTVGTTINLPTAPNSIMADPAGTTVYLGSGSALFGVNVSTGAITTYAVPGVIRAISPDGRYVLLSNSSNSTVSYVNVATATLANNTSGTTNSSAFSPESLFNEWINASSDPPKTQLASGPQTGPPGFTDLPSAADALDISAQGGLTYLASAMGGQVLIYSTCNQTQNQALAATSPTLVKALPNGTGAVVADPPNLDVIATPATLDPGCPVTTQSSPIASYDLQAGAFTAQQLLITGDAKKVWIVTSLPQLLGFDLMTHTPSQVPLTGGATAFNGGITNDGSRVYVGTSDGTVHQIDTASMTDAAQIQVNLKDTGGNPVVPNLVAVVP
jgi:YVTN family beta-propeller protein